MESEIPKAKQPTKHRAKVCTWEYLSVSDFEALDLCRSPEELRGFLLRILPSPVLTPPSQSHPLLSQQRDILLDMYFGLVQFAREQQFNGEQTSALFSILTRVHLCCVESPFGNLEACFAYFREMLICHSVRRPPYSVEIFTPEQTKRIAFYITNSYFRHFKLYKYAFTPAMRVNLRFTYMSQFGKEIDREPAPEKPVAAPSAATLVSAAPAAAPASTSDDLERRETDAELEHESLTLVQDSVAPSSHATPHGGETSAELPQIATVEALSAAAPELARQLREWVKTALNDELRRVRLAFDEQLRTADEHLARRLGNAESGGVAPASRSSRSNSSRGKK